MRRLLFLMLLCSPLLFVSCEQNYYGSVDTYYMDVRQTDWKGVGTYGQPGFILEAAYDVGFITQDVLENGAVLVYLVDSVLGDMQLPYVLTRRVGTSDFIEMLSYQIYNGGIAFMIDASDYLADPYAGTIQFKIVVVR